MAVDMYVRFDNLRQRNEVDHTMQTGTRQIWNDNWFLQLTHSIFSVSYPTVPGLIFKDVLKLICVSLRVQMTTSLFLHCTLAVEVIFISSSMKYCATVKQAFVRPNQLIYQTQAVVKAYRSS